MNSQKRYFDPDKIIAILWSLKREQIIEDLQRVTDNYPVIICDPIDTSTPSPDDEDTQVDYRSAGNGAS